MAKPPGNAGLIEKAFIEPLVIVGIKLGIAVPLVYVLLGVG